MPDFGLYDALAYRHNYAPDYAALNKLAAQDAAKKKAQDESVKLMNSLIENPNLEGGSPYDIKMATEAAQNAVARGGAMVLNNRDWNTDVAKFIPIKQTFHEAVDNEHYHRLKAHIPERKAMAEWLKNNGDNKDLAAEQVQQLINYDKYGNPDGLVTDAEGKPVYKPFQWSSPDTKVDERILKLVNSFGEATIPVTKPVTKKDGSVVNEIVFTPTLGGREKQLVVDRAVVDRDAGAAWDYDKGIQKKYPVKADFQQYVFDHTKKGKDEEKYPYKSTTDVTNIFYDKDATETTVGEKMRNSTFTGTMGETHTNKRKTDLKAKLEKERAETIKFNEEEASSWNPLKPDKKDVLTDEQIQGQVDAIQADVAEHFSTMNTNVNADLALASSSFTRPQDPASGKPKATIKGKLRNAASVLFTADGDPISDELQKKIADKGIESLTAEEAKGIISQPMLYILADPDKGGNSYTYGVPLGANKDTYRFVSGGEKVKADMKKTYEEIIAQAEKDNADLKRITGATTAPATNVPKAKKDWTKFKR